jgi:GDPmannose 4,6-dehydratase
MGLASEVRLGNLDARRDWGHSADYVRAMRMMLQQPESDDYVISTGETHSVREFCELAFAEVQLDYRDFVRVDEAFYRPAEVDLLIGDPSKARRILGWEPKHTFRDLVTEMVQSDLANIQRTIRDGRATYDFGQSALTSDSAPTSDRARRP